MSSRLWRSQKNQIYDLRKSAPEKRKSGTRLYVETNGKLLGWNSWNPFASVVKFNNVQNISYEGDV